MKTSSLKLLCLTTLLLLVFSLSGPLWAQKIVQVESPTFDEARQEPDADGNVIIFSNLGPPALGKFATSPYDAAVIAGKKAAPDVETWGAVLFIPKSDVQAKTLAAAIEYLSGTRLVNLGIYSSDDVTGTVGTLIPGGQGSTTQIPDSGTCCRLAKVTLAGAGVSLKANTPYWLVASPDDVNGADFDGRWQLTTKATSNEYSFGVWEKHLGPWPTAQIRGTLNEKREATQFPANASRQSSKEVALFNNLGPRPLDPLYYPGVGLEVAGSAAGGLESRLAIPFTPAANAHAKTLFAPIGYESGTEKVNLGIYTDNGGNLGTPLPGGQGSTTELPPAGMCCHLAKIVLPGAGVALTAGVQYWLVASADDVTAPTFKGLWQVSTRAAAAYQEPTVVINWTSVSGYWLAARIQGTIP